MPDPRLVFTGLQKITEIDCSNRLRPVSEAGVESIITSINQLGVMQDAIHLRRKKDGRLVLLKGLHRLEAARRLGWEEVEVKVWTDVTDDWSRFMEIDDNLAGAELTALDKAVFLAERKRIYEKLHPETKRGVAGAASRWDATELSSFASTAADAAGMTARQIRKIIAAGGALAPDEIEKLRGAPKQVTLADLQAIGKINSAPEREHVVDALAEGRLKKAAAARAEWKALDNGTVTALKDPVEEAFKGLLTAWQRAPKKAQARFVRHEIDALQAILDRLDDDEGAA